MLQPADRAGPLSDRDGKLLRSSVRRRDCRRGGAAFKTMESQRACGTVDIARCARRIAGTRAYDGYLRIVHCDAEAAPVQINGWIYRHRSTGIDIQVREDHGYSASFHGRKQLVYIDKSGTHIVIVLPEIHDLRLGESHVRLILVVELFTA